VMEAELTAIHVTEVGPGLPLDIDVEVLDQAGKEILSRARQIAAQNSVSIATRLLRAHHAGQALVSEATDQKIDLLIMGYHCRQGVAEMFGSTVRYVAQHAPCRVLVEAFLLRSTRYSRRRCPGWPSLLCLNYLEQLLIP